MNVRYVGLHVPTATPHPVGLTGRERTICGFTCTYSCMHSLAFTTMVVTSIHTYGEVYSTQNALYKNVMQSVSITTRVVSLNSAVGEVYSIQHYVMKFLSVFRQFGGFLRVIRFPLPINLATTI